MLEVCNLLIGESVGLGDDWDEVDLGVKSTHDLDVQGLERVAGRLNEVDTSMHAVVDDVHPVHLVLCIEIRIESLLDVLDNWPPGVIVVDEVTEARGIHNGQAKADAVLLNIGRDGLYTHSLRCELKRRLLALLGRVKRGIEQRVDQSRLAKTRLTCGKLALPDACLHASHSPTTITLKLKPLRTLLRCH